MARVSGSATSFEDHEAQPGRVYEYQVVAEVAAGDLSIGTDLGQRQMAGVALELFVI